MAQNNFTVKASEALQQAQQIAFNNKNPNIETEHLLKTLIDTEDYSIDYILKKNNVTVNLVTNKLNELIKKLPIVSGEPAQSMGREANSVLLRANGVLKTFGDEFINITFKSPMACQEHNEEVVYLTVFVIHPYK